MVMFVILIHLANVPPNKLTELYTLGKESQITDSESNSWY